MLSLEEIRDYLYCSLLYYLKHQSQLLEEAGIVPDGKKAPLPAYTTLDLPRLSISQALAVYASGQAPELDFPRLVSLVWDAWFTQKKLDKQLLGALHDYAGYRKNILDQFTSGKIRGKDNQPYQEPRMTRRYKDLMESSGLLRLANDIDSIGLIGLKCVRGELPGIGLYSLADAYSDSLHMASGYQPPAREAIFGVQVQTVVRLVNGEGLEAKANLIILPVLPDRPGGHDATLVEVHDFSPSFIMPRSWVGRRLEVIAAFWMEAADPAKQFPPVERVVYRHWMSGKTVERKSVREARLIFALEAASRGIQAGIYIPQFLSGELSRCRQCPVQEVCIPASGDLVEWFLPGEAEYRRG